MPKVQSSPRKVTYVTPAQVCEMLPGMTENTLTIWRHYRRGPSFVKVGRRVFYDLDAIRQWIDSGVTTCNPKIANLGGRR